MNEDNIKALIPIICPHCSKSMVVELTTQASLLDIETANEILKNIKDEPEEKTPKGA